LLHRKKGIVSPIYVVFEYNSNIIFPEYLYLILKTETYKHIFNVSTNASVDRRGNLRWKEFAQIKVPVPSLNEQKCILGIVNSIKNEIEKQNVILNRIKDQKKGLMPAILIINSPFRGLGGLVATSLPLKPQKGTYKEFTSDVYIKKTDNENCWAYAEVVDWGSSGGG